MSVDGPANKTCIFDPDVGGHANQPTSLLLHSSVPRRLHQAQAWVQLLSRAMTGQFEDCMCMMIQSSAAADQAAAAPSHLEHLQPPTNNTKPSVIPMLDLKTCNSK